MRKDSDYVLILTNQNCKLSDGVIRFPKVFEGFTMSFQHFDDPKFVSFQQVRIVPHKTYLSIEIVYTVLIEDQKKYNGRCIAVDIGVNNLACVCNNFHAPAFIINGKPLKSINQYYNKEYAFYYSKAESVNYVKSTKRLSKLGDKRSFKINDYLHKASRYIVDYCVENQVTMVIIGKNDSWKQNVDMGDQNNQNFVYIPFTRFIDMIVYKAKQYGITVVMTEESYTSGTSFIDDEDPSKQCYDKSRRIFRGLFRSNCGMLINSDLNGAYQIMKKVVPMKWDRGCVLHPSIVNVA